MQAIQAIRAINAVNELRRPRRRKIYNKRTNPIEDLPEIEFRRRYRFAKATIQYIVELVRGDLTKDRRGAGLTPELQVLTAIRCWGRKEVQDDAAELHGLSQPTVSRVCAAVARALAKHSAHYIKMPCNAAEREIACRRFFALRAFPTIIGCIDCTHIKIKKCGGDAAQYYINRKGIYSLNVQVSWIRHRDLHILTVGGYTYTSDQRFQATHSPQTDDWTLHIKWAQQRDAGVYECQVSTQPVRSFFVTLHVVVPSARILGGPDLHVDMGSTINLTCLIQFSPEPPAYIFWYHEDEVISYDSSRGGVSVVTEKGAATTSYLLVQDAAPADSGRYSCSPSNAEVASVRVHVLNGERPAAMQTGSAGLSNSSHCIAALLALAALHARWLRARLDR